MRPLQTVKCGFERQMDATPFARKDWAPAVALDVIDERDRNSACGRCSLRQHGECARYDRVFGRGPRDRHACNCCHRLAQLHHSRLAQCFGCKSRDRCTPAAREPDAMLEATAMAVLRGTVLALIFFALRYGYAQWRGRQGLGLGDVKLAFVAGAWLDWLMIPLAIQLAAFAALSAYLRAAACIWSIDVGDQPDAIWSVFGAGDLDLLAS